MVGEGGQEVREILEGEVPIEHGIIKNWDAMERVWEHTFKKLNVLVEDKPLILSETPNNVQFNRERVAQIMFETYNVPTFYLGNEAVLSAYFAGKVNALVVDSGYDCSYVVPVFEGYPVAQGVLRFDYGGKDITNYLSSLLVEEGDYSLGPGDVATVEAMKRKHAFASMDYEKDLHTKGEGLEMLHRSFSYEGKDYNLTRSRFRCAEGLFKPQLMGKQAIGLHAAVFHSIGKCDIEMRDDLWSNVVLCGGNMAINNMPARMRREIVATSSSLYSAAVTTPQNAKQSVWGGASIMAGLTTFNHMWIHKEEYDETGPSIVSRKCIS